MKERRLLRTNKIHSTIKAFEDMFPEEFRKTDIKKCGHCRATGLYKIGGHFTVDKFCEYCGGMGYKGFKKLDGEFVCRVCNGHGCKKCGYNGIVDWISHARGKDILGKDDCVVL